MILSILDLVETEITLDLSNGILSVEVPSLTKTGKFFAGVVGTLVVVAVAVAVVQEVLNNR